MPCLFLFSSAFTTEFISYGISGINIISAPPAIPAWSVSHPTLCPITSTINTLPCDAAVVWIQSIALVAIFTALWKPNVISVPHISLSIVFGSVTTLHPSSLRRLAVLCVPFPPRITRQSSPHFL